MVCGLCINKVIKIRNKEGDIRKYACICSFMQNKYKKDKSINQKIKRFITYRGYVAKSGRKGKIRKG